MSETDLHAALEALVAGTASRTQSQLLREALEGGRIVLASGERAVAVGGNAEGAIIVTGDNTFVLSLDRAAAGAVQQAFAGLFLPRLHQLPVDLADFTGREREVNELVALLGSSEGGVATVSVVGGMGGAGKSALAIHVAHQLASRYPDGQLFVELGGTWKRPLSTQEAFARVVRSFEPAAHLPDEESELAAVYRSILADRRVLLILDDARDAAQVRPLVPPGSSALIVTSRRTLRLPGARQFELGGLDKTEALGLLAGIVSPDRTDRVTLDEIAGLCGYLPLALRVAGTFLAVHEDWGAGDYARALADERQRLRRLRLEDDSALDVAASLGLSAAQLAQENPTLVAQWRLLSVFPSDFDRQAAAAVWSVENEMARDGLSALTVRSMVLYDPAAARYRLHSLMRDVARGVYLEDEQGAAPRREATEQGARRHAVHFCGTLMRANLLYMRGGDAALEGLGLFDAERPNIEAGQAWAARNLGDDKQAAYLCLEFVYQGAYILKLRQSMYQTSLWARAALDAARCHGEREREAGALISLGNAHADLGETDHARELWSRAVEIAREEKLERVEAVALSCMAHNGMLNDTTAIQILLRGASIAKDQDDPRTEAACLGNAAIIYRRLGESDQALRICERGLAVAREIGDPQLECTNLGILGNAYLDVGAFQAGAKLHEERLEIARRICDSRNEMDALTKLGYIYIKEGDYDVASMFLRQELEAGQRYQNRPHQASALHGLGVCSGASDTRGKAAKYFEAELAIRRELGKPDDTMIALENLGRAHAIAGDQHRAISFFDQSLALAREIGHREGEANVLCTLGNIQFELGDAVRAVEFYEQALPVLRDLGDRQGEANTLGNLGDAYSNFGDTRRAIDFYKQALTIGRSLDDIRGRARAFDSLGRAHLGLGEAGPAREYFEEALIAEREIRDRGGEARALSNLGLAHAITGGSLRAIEFYEQTLPLLHEVGDRQHEANTVGNLGNAYRSLGAVARAKKLYDRHLLLARKLGDREGEARALFNSAIVLGQLGAKKEAASKAFAALGIFEQIGAPEVAPVRELLSRLA